MKRNLPTVRRSGHKRVLAAVLACMAALALMVPAFAHGHGGGHHGGTRHAESRVALCETENCQLAGRHVHDEVTYCGNHHAEGFCTENCAPEAEFAMSHHGSLHRGHHH